MSDGKIVELTPGFEKPPLNSIVAVEAVDWGYIAQEVSSRSEFGTTSGTIWGKVIGCDDACITLTFQAFANGNVRCVLSIPWVTVTQVTILQTAADG